MINKEKYRIEMPCSREHENFSFCVRSNLKNEPGQYDAPAKMLLLSDIEGNFLPFRRLLIKCGVIDSRHNWIFEKGHLVIAGDCFDRGNQVIECLWLIYSLEEKAKLAGGYVHFILGNHEIMNLNGDWRYIHPKYANPVDDKKTFTALYDGNITLWQWLLTKNIIEKIGDILVVHGGISPEMNFFPYSVSEINTKARPFYTFATQIFDDPLLYLIFNSNQSPFWYRGYYHGNANEAQVDATLAHFGIHTIITGHTIVSRVSTFFNGKVINVNTDHAAGNSEALLIKNSKFYRVSGAGKHERIK
ncbi:metallophosphoesterase [Niastella caeni]|uniref:Metallophosphoesterase n=1 Tax=Niastella caeni TaxID=2569763 RepID=A0A4S8HYR9_9BACT|nr:metallophosphoesterase [Niastella caeni]THU39314.1 metallophosphoesterase [Niastella caeni]